MVIACFACMHGNGNGMAVSNYTTQVRASERASPSHLPAENDLKGHEIYGIQTSSVAYKVPSLTCTTICKIQSYLSFLPRLHHDSFCVFEVLNCPISIFLYIYI
jgi:hypothetical protein